MVKHIKNHKIIALTGLIVFCTMLLLGFHFLKADKEVIYDIEKTPASLDPQRSPSHVCDTVIKNTYEGLIKKDQEQNLVKGVCEHYTVSEDGLVYTFEIKENAIWNNSEKTPVTSHDFVFAFRRLFENSKKKSALRFLNIKNASAIYQKEKDVASLGVTALGDKTVRFTLEKPDDNFLALLTAPAAMPCNEAFFNEHRESYATSAETSLTNGVFYIAHFAQNNKIVLKKNRNYQTGQPAQISQIHFIVTPDKQKQLERFQNGKTDLFFHESPSSQAELPKNTRGIQTKTWVLLFNPQSEIFKQVCNRKAFLAAGDFSNTKTQLPFNLNYAKTLYCNNVTVGSKSYPNIVGQTAPQFKKEQAATLCTLTDSQLQNIDLLVANNKSCITAANNFAQKCGENLKAGVNVLNHDENTLMDKVLSGNFTFALVPVSSFSAKGGFSVVGLSKGSFMPDFEKKGIVDLHSQLLSDPSQANRIQVLMETERLLFKNHLVQPLYYETEYFSLSKKVKDIYYLPGEHVIDFRYAKR